MTGWSVGRFVRSFVSSSLLLLAVWLGWLVPLPERGHLGSQAARVKLSSNFLRNETPATK